MKQKTSNGVLPVMRSVFLPMETTPLIGNLDHPTKVPYLDMSVIGDTVFYNGNPEWMPYDKLMEYSSTNPGVSVTVYKAMALIRGFLNIPQYSNLPIEIGRIKFIKGNQVSVINIKNNLDEEPAVGSNHSSGFIGSSAVEDLAKRINKAIVDISRRK